MWSNLSALSLSLLNPAKCFTQSKRTTYILKRLFEPSLNSLSAEKPKRLKKRHYYYELVENTNITSKPLLDVVLTENVPGLGVKGEKVQMNRYAAYKHILLPKLGLYADLPEAQEIARVAEGGEFTSANFKMVEKYLATQSVAITLTADTKWKLEPWHVRVALRKIGIMTKDECITIPREITGPDPEIENRDFLVKLTMNKKEKFLLRCRLYFWSSSNPMQNRRVIDLRSPSEPLFPEEKEQIDAIIKLDLETRRKKMMSGK